MTRGPGSMGWFVEIDVRELPDSATPRAARAGVTSGAPWALYRSSAMRLPLRPRRATRALSPRPGLEVGMRCMTALVLSGLVFASPSPAKEYPPCPTGTRIPVSYHVATPACAGQPLNLIVEACGPCVHLDQWMPAPLRIQATMTLPQCIFEICQFDSLTIPIGTFAAGHHLLVVQVFGNVLHSDSTQSCTAVQFDSVAFDVPYDCPSTQPLPYTDVIRIGPPPIRPGDSIPFTIAGRLPNTCYEFRGLELLPSNLANPLPQPPIARVTVAHDECSGAICEMVTVPWEAKAMLPPLPGGLYSMRVELRDVIECGTQQPPLDTVFTTNVPFEVAASCGPTPPGCFLYEWRGSSTDSGCTARVGPGTPGRLTLDLTTLTPLAGLQGRLTLDPAPLLITDLSPVGPAAGMHLTWQPLADGASFVMFADHGAPIHSAQPCATCPPSPVPVLEVTLAEKPGAPTPPLSLLGIAQLVAADSLGVSVPQCPTFAAIPPARICAGASCDFNRDGFLDIRDLARIVRCVRDPSTCPDSASTDFDCNGDGRLGLEDAFCCAPEAIHHPIPDNAPRRPAPVDATAGTPRVAGVTVEVPIRLNRADLVGAARLAFRIGAGEFFEAFAYAPDDSAGWFLPVELGASELLFGLIANGPMFPGAGLNVVLRLTLVDAQSSVDVALVASEFAGLDGVALSPPDPPAAVPPVAAERIRLSVAQPNPFAGETRLVLTLAQASVTDVAVFDLSGRRVATLLHGLLGAGSHPLRWDGSQSSGARAPDGVYLLRATGVGAAAMRKLVLLHAP